MYTFYDTHPKDVPTTGTLPVEALTVDGITIERVIPEYQTLQVTGREILANTVTSLKVGSQDGSRLRQSSKPERTITVKYQINAPNQQRFREIYYQLNQILGGQDKKISFADDPDKYFIGTLTDTDTPEGGRLAVFELYLHLF